MSLTTSSGGTIRGRIVSDSGEAFPVEQKMRVTARAVDSMRTFLRADPDNGRVADDLTFEIRSLIGANRLFISPVPTGWALRSILHEGVDLIDTPIDVQGGRTVDGVTVVLSKTLPDLKGTLTNAAGQPAEGTVLLFPEDAARWEEQSRLIRSIRPGTDSIFEFADVIPGDYLIVGLEYVRTGDWADPAFLENLRRHAKRVRVEEGVVPSPVVLTLTSGSR